MKINNKCATKVNYPKTYFVSNWHKMLTSIFALFMYSASLYAQNEKEILDFLHSGTVTTNKASVKIPIEIWNDLILLKVKVNGNDATFMWDNGFSFSGIDKSLVDDYKFLPYKSANKTTATDGNNVAVSLNFLVCPKVEIYNIAISNTPFIQLDFRTITMTKELKIEGIIGASIINKLNWRFDFDKNHVEISEKPFNVNNDDLILPFKIVETNNNHIMPIAFNDSNTDCIIDFGYNSDVIEINTANAKFFSEANATKTFGPASVSISGLAPIDTIYTIKDNFSWKLSGLKLNAKPKLSFTKSSHNVIIGNKLFRNTYNVVVNTSGNTLYALTPRSKSDPLFTDNSYGYRIHNIDGNFKIISIYSNDNTIDNDIKLLDEVLSINGKVPADFKDSYSLKVYQKELLEKNQTMVLKFKNGKEIRLDPKPAIEYKFKNEKELW